MITNSKKGFTLLELLIVIAIIAILSVVLIVALNPAETLRKTRDSQRISDLSSLKTALGIYVTTITSPLLDGVDNSACQAVSGTYDAGDKVWYSIATAAGGGTDITDANVDGAVAVDAQVATPSLVNGSGWVPVNLSSITGGSPISNMPLDPSNDITAGGSTAAAVTTDALVYRYTCAADNVTFEMNANLESIAFTSTDNKEAKDGGNNANLYEVGTATNLLGAGADL